MSKDMYLLKKLLQGLDMRYEKVDVCKDGRMLFFSEKIMGKMRSVKCLPYRGTLRS
jgi:hypothetical protein